MRFANIGRRWLVVPTLLVGAWGLALGIDRDKDVARPQFDAELPHSHIALQVPTAFFRIEGDRFYERVGIEPTLVVEPGTDALAVARAWLHGYLSARPASAD